MLDILLSPYRTYKQVKAKEKELRRRDSLDSKKLSREQLKLMVERDIDKIIEENFDSGLKTDVTVSYTEDTREYLINALESQGFQYVDLEDGTLVIKE